MDRQIWRKAWDIESKEVRSLSSFVFILHFDIVMNGFGHSYIFEILVKFVISGDFKNIYFKIYIKIKLNNQPYLFCILWGQYYCDFREPILFRAHATDEVFELQIQLSKKKRPFWIETSHLLLDSSKVPVQYGYLSESDKSPRIFYLFFFAQVEVSNPFFVKDEIPVFRNPGHNCHHHCHRCLFQLQPAMWSYPNTPWEDCHALVSLKST